MLSKNEIEHLIKEFGEDKVATFCEIMAYILFTERGKVEQTDKIGDILEALEYQRQTVHIKFKQVCASKDLRLKTYLESRGNRDAIIK